MKVKTFKNHSVKTESSSTVSSSTGQNMFIALAGDKTEQKSKRGDVAATGVKINNSCRDGIDLLNFILSLIHFRPCCHTLLACLFSFAFCLLEGMNSLSDIFSQLLSEILVGQKLVNLERCILRGPQLRYLIHSLLFVYEFRDQTQDLLLWSLFTQKQPPEKWVQQFLKLSTNGDISFSGFFPS